MAIQHPGQTGAAAREFSGDIQGRLDVKECQSRVKTPGQGNGVPRSHSGSGRKVGWQENFRYCQFHSFPPIPRHIKASLPKLHALLQNC